MRVRRRPVPRDAGPAACALVLIVVSVVFAVTAVPALPGAGAILYLVAGVAGTVLFTSGVVAMTGQLTGHRPVLELDDQGVRLPAPWPLPRTRDRFLRWPEVAAAVVWSRPVPRGRRGLADHLGFLPAAESAERTLPSPSAELLALGLGDLPGVATTHWSVQASPGWDTGVDEVVAELRRRDLPTIDARAR